MDTERYQIGIEGIGAYIPPGVIAIPSDRLSWPAKVVIGWFLARKGKECRVYWLQEDIMKAMQITCERTLRRYIKELCDCNLIVSVRRDNRQGRPNEYLFQDNPDLNFTPAQLSQVRSILAEHNIKPYRTSDDHYRTSDDNLTGHQTTILQDKSQQCSDMSGNLTGQDCPVTPPSYRSGLSGKDGFDDIYRKENSRRKENSPLPPNLAGPSVATNGSQNLDNSFFPKETQTNSTTLKGHQAIPEAKPYANGNIAEPEGSTNPGTLPSLPPTPLPAAAPLAGYEDESWEPQLGVSRWNRTKGLPKLNAEAKRWIEHQHEQGIGDIPWSTVEAALEAFAANDEMKGKGHPYRAFWKNPAAWAPNRQETRQNAPGRFRGIQTPTPPPAAPPCPDSTSAVAHFVEMWNRDNPHSATDATIANSWDWQECIRVELFRKEFSRIAQWCGFLRDDCGLTYVNLPWVLRKQHGVKKRNWERLIEGDFLPTGWSRYPQTREEADAQKRDSDEVMRDLASKRLPPKTPEEIEVSRQRYAERKAKWQQWVAELHARQEAKRQAQLQDVINSPDYDPFAVIAGVDAA